MWNPVGFVLCNVNVTSHDTKPMEDYGKFIRLSVYKLVTMLIDEKYPFILQ